MAPAGSMKVLELFHSGKSCLESQLLLHIQSVNGRLQNIRGKGRGERVNERVGWLGYALASVIKVLGMKLAYVCNCWQYVMV